MKAFIVRHGKSEANVRIEIAIPETPLAEEGLEQAKSAGKDLSKFKPTLVLSSPFLRAQQTAEIIAGEVGLAVSSIKIIDELAERRMGSLEGKPREFEPLAYFDNELGAGAESREQLLSRVKKAVDEIKDLSKGTKGPIVIVGHSITCFFLLQVIKGKTKLADFEPSNHMSNAEFVEADI